MLSIAIKCSHRRIRSKCRPAPRCVENSERRMLATTTELISRGFTSTTIMKQMHKSTMSKQTYLCVSVTYSEKSRSKTKRQFLPPFESADVVPFEFVHIIWWRSTRHSKMATPTKVRAWKRSKHTFYLLCADLCQFLTLFQRKWKAQSQPPCVVRRTEVV